MDRFRTVHRLTVNYIPVVYRHPHLSLLLSLPKCRMLLLQMQLFENIYTFGHFDSECIEYSYQVPAVRISHKLILNYYGISSTVFDGLQSQSQRFIKKEVEKSKGSTNIQILYEPSALEMMGHYRLY